MKGIKKREKGVPSLSCLSLAIERIERYTFRARKGERENEMQSAHLFLLSSSAAERWSGGERRKKRGESLFIPCLSSISVFWPRIKRKGNVKISPLSTPPTLLCVK